jgi:hypothetical protein
VAVDFEGLGALGWVRSTSPAMMVRGYFVPWPFGSLEGGTIPLMRM